jgi:cytochrome c553
VAATGPRAISPANGDLLWRKSLGSSRGACIDCHGVPKPDVVNNLLKINNAMGTAADQGVPSAIRRGIQTSSQMAEFAAVSDADLADLAAYVNAIKYGKPLTDAAGVVPEKPYVLVQNGAIVTPPIYMPPIVFGSASSVRVTMALQAPVNAVLHVERLAMDKGMFTINRVPVASVDQAAIAAADAATSKTDGTATASTKTDVQAAGTVNNSQACAPGAFDLQPGQACGIEVVFAVSNPGVVNANLEIYTDPAGAQKPETIAIVSTVTAEAKGGQGGGGCTMRSTPEAFDPMLLLLSFLSLIVLAVRRSKKPEA